MNERYIFYFILKPNHGRTVKQVEEELKRVNDRSYQKAFPLDEMGIPYGSAYEKTISDSAIDYIGKCAVSDETIEEEKTKIRSLPNFYKFHGE